MANEIKVTNEGLKNLKDELNFLKEVKRNEVVEAIRLALSYGDLSENSEYDEAKTEQARVESRIQRSRNKDRYRKYRRHSQRCQPE